ncbi:MAG TPA: YciI family protein [Trebonia sp.]|jgi:hypothetical protein|nr:YciI family protein [Trebonia sp.]
MKYLMIVCIDPTIDPASDPALAAADDPGDTDAWVAEMDGRGVRLEGRALDPREATTVRVRAGQVLLADGPFAETKEFMVGYDMLDCKDLDEAIEVASKHPLAKRGAMELRPFSGE